MDTPGFSKDSDYKVFNKVKKCKFLPVSWCLYLGNIVKLVKVMADKVKIEAVLDLLNLNKAHLVTVMAGVVPSRIFSKHKEQALKVEG